MAMEKSKCTPGKFQQRLFIALHWIFFFFSCTREQKDCPAGPKREVGFRSVLEIVCAFSLWPFPTTCKKIQQQRKSTGTYLDIYVKLYLKCSLAYILKIQVDLRNNYPEDMSESKMRISVKNICLGLLWSSTWRRRGRSTLTRSSTRGSATFSSRTSASTSSKSRLKHILLEMSFWRK